MGYIVTNGGAQEAAIFAMKNLIVSNLPGFNACLQRDSYTNAIPEVTPKMVTIGGGTGIWSDRFGWIKIEIMQGEFPSGQSIRSRREFIDMTPHSGLIDTITHIISVILLDKCFISQDILAQEEKREVVLARISDYWRAGVLNYYSPVLSGNTMVSAGNIEIALTSQETTTAPSTDRLTNCMVTAVSRGATFRSFGGDISLMGIHLTHESELI